jgi:hypothetical protein
MEDAMAAELVQFTTRQQRIDALYKEIEPEVLAAARAIGIEGQSREMIRAGVKRELRKYGWDEDAPDINLSWLLPRLACLIEIEELLSGNDDEGSARLIIAGSAAVAVDDPPGWRVKDAAESQRERDAAAATGERRRSICASLQRKGRPPST